MRCTACQFDLPAGAAVYRYRAARKAGPVVVQCADCAARTAARERWSWNAEWQWRPPVPCGGCGRPVIDRDTGWTMRERRHVVCGADACRRATRAATARALRRQPCVCDGCGSTFKPARGDAHYCSPACKQRAYRQRQSVTARL